MSKIGKNIKKIRNVKSLSQQAFSELFSLTRSNISSYEELRAEPKIETIVSIAKYFGIPIEDFITKDLSVNELLHYNTELVLETERLKRGQQLINVPYISAAETANYVANHDNESFIRTTPHIVIPSSSKFNMLAIEVESSDNFPLGFDFKNGDVLIFENVVKENMHRIINKFGMTVDTEGMKMGIFTEMDHKIFLTLNEWVQYPFDIESNSNYWVLKIASTQIL